MDLSPKPLKGRFVWLEPYAEAAKDDLRTALDCDHDAWALFSRAGFGEHFNSWWAQAAQSSAAKSAVNFTIRRRSDQRIVGTTSFLNARPVDGGVEIGATFLHPDVRSGAVNPEAKRLMLAYAFDGGLFGEPAHRVEILTDERNLRSQAAIRKLGATWEGVLRRNKRTWTGHVRDTVVFAILAEDWPKVRDGLDARLAGMTLRSRDGTNR